MTKRGTVSTPNTERTWTATIPRWHPARLNELLGNRFKRARLKKADVDMVFAYTGWIPWPLCTKRRVSLTIVLKKGQRGADPDAYFKSLGDAMVQCGLLCGDSGKWVEWAPVRFERSDVPSTVITIEDI